MAAVDSGVAHLWGIEGTVTNAAVQSFSSSIEFANKGQTEDENGGVVERRSDDRTTTATITLKYRSGYTIPTVGTNLTYNSVIYEITKVGKETKNKDFRMVTLELITNEFITLT